MTDELSQCHGTEKATNMANPLYTQAGIQTAVGHIKPGGLSLSSSPAGGPEPTSVDEMIRDLCATMGALCDAVDALSNRVHGEKLSNADNGALPAYVGESAWLYQTRQRVKTSLDHANAAFEELTRISKALGI